MPTILYLLILGKLVYVLCSKCLKEKRQGLCDHDDEERALESEWTTAEIFKAVKVGYRLDTLFEAFLYPESDYLFRDYYLHLAKIKV